MKFLTWFFIEHNMSGIKSRTLTDSMLIFRNNLFLQFILLLWHKNYIQNKFIMARLNTHGPLRNVVISPAIMPTSLFETWRGCWNTWEPIIHCFTHPAQLYWTAFAWVGTELVSSTLTHCSGLLLNVCHTGKPEGCAFMGEISGRLLKTGLKYVSIKPKTERLYRLPRMPGGWPMTQKCVLRKQSILQQPPF